MTPGQYAEFIGFFAFFGSAGTSLLFIIAMCAISIARRGKP